MNNFEVKIDVRWSDVDANRHVRHSAYYDYGAHARIRFFQEIGFDSQKMQELSIGPILFKEECSFIKELRGEEAIIVNLLKGNMTEDVSRWELHHEIYNQDNLKCAHITIKGAWMDLTKRKLTIPPQDIVKHFHALPVGESYVYKKSTKK